MGTLLFSFFAAPLFPDWLSIAVGADSVESVLKILASSMLAVTTFSLGTMVSALSAVSNSTTPRASKILIEDSTSLNALSTFIGAFIFSLIGIIALSTGYYGTREKFVLFLVMLFVVVLIIITFFRWIDYLSRLGRIGEIIDKVEKTHLSTVKAVSSYSYIGDRTVKSAPFDAFSIMSPSIGYIQYLKVEKLSKIAEDCEGEIYVMRVPGTFADKNRPLVLTTWVPTQEQIDQIVGAFTIGNERLFDQDPRFGLVVLSEIASHALSPAINDPGTAIDIIGRLVRVLTLMFEKIQDSGKESFARVMIPPVTIADLFDDSFTSIARDGAGNIGVATRLQKGLLSLAKLDSSSYLINAKRHSGLALSRSALALSLKEDYMILSELAQNVKDL